MDGSEVVEQFVPTLNVAWLYMYILYFLLIFTTMKTKTETI